MFLFCVFYGGFRVRGVGSDVLGSFELHMESVIGFVWTVLGILVERAVTIVISLVWIFGLLLIAETLATTCGPL